jgi:hypothetical protein
VAKDRNAGTKRNGEGGEDDQRDVLENVEDSGGLVGERHCVVLSDETLSVPRTLKLSLIHHDHAISIRLV